MNTLFTQTCPQAKRALRLLLSPNAPRIDQQKLIDALPGPTPADPKELVDLIIQIILALMENKPDDKPEKPDGQADDYTSIRETARDVAIATIKPDLLEQDLPKLIASIDSIASMIPVPGFQNFRTAREAMRLANNKALGFSAKTWHEWNTAIRTQMDILSTDGHLNKFTDYKLAWTAITEGLETID